MMKTVFGLFLFFLCGAAFADPFSAIGAVTSILGSAGTAALGALGGAMAGKKLFGGSKAPKVKPPAVMPTMSDDQVKDARRRQIAAMQSRSGRASTILSDGDKLGG